LTRLMKINPDFNPCAAVAGDELYPNGIFVFNINKMVEYIKKNPDAVILEDVNTNDFPSEFSSIDESHMNSVVIGEPVILGEIAPDRYNLIDGNHRMEKARRLEIKTISAYKIKAEQHVQFLINKDAYLSYVEYWNSKLK
jgi:hypothetical protein